MLPLENRLLLRRDFELIKKRGKKIQGELFGLLVLKTQNDYSRLGFILSTKLSKKAVKRNRAKRQLREAVREFLPKAKPGFDIIFLGKKGVLEADFKQIKRGVKEVFQQASLLR